MWVLIQPQTTECVPSHAEIVPRTARYLAIKLVLYIKVQMNMESRPLSQPNSISIKLKKSGAAFLGHHVALLDEIVNGQRAKEPCFTRSSHLRGQNIDRLIVR